MAESYSDITDIELQRISDKILPTEWKCLGRYLEVDVLDQIEYDHQKYGIAEVVFQMLKSWQMKCCKATKRNICEALEKMGRLDIARELVNDSACLETTARFRSLLMEIQENQREKFKRLLLPRSLGLQRKWLPLEEMFVELTMKSKNERGKEVNSKNITKEEVFEKQRNEVPKRILVEGHPGYGKTTLITKFLYDWARGEMYIKDKFDLVFVIPLQIFKERLEDHLIQQCGITDVGEEEKLAVIKSIQERVLLLLDGLDEASEKVKDRILPLLKKEQYRQWTVLITCRTGFNRLKIKSDDEFSVMGNVGFEKHSLWDKRFQIEGIPFERRFDFLSNYLKIEKEELNIKISVLNVDVDDEFYGCPLFLLLLGVLLQEEKTESIKSKTELFKTFVNFVVNRSLDREKLLSQNKELDIFDIENEDGFNSRRLLINFGQLCLEKLKIESLLFGEKELMGGFEGNEVILKGFFSIQLSFFSYEETSSYELIHSTFREFFAALYLSSLDDVKLNEELKNLFMKFNIWPGEDQLVFPILGGFKLFLVRRLLSFLVSLPIVRRLLRRLFPI